MGPIWGEGINPGLETLCFYFGSIFGKGNEGIEWEALTELVVPLLVAKIRNLGSQRDKKESFEPSGRNKFYFYNSSRGSAAVKVLLLAWPHNIFLGCPQYFQGCSDWFVCV